MRGKGAITERQAFELEQALHDKIIAREQRRQEALARASSFDDFPEKVRALWLAYEKAVEASQKPQERTEASEV